MARAIATPARSEATSGAERSGAKRSGAERSFLCHLCVLCVFMWCLLGWSLAVGCRLVEMWLEVGCEVEKMTCGAIMRAIYKVEFCRCPLRFREIGSRKGHGKNHQTTGTHHARMRTWARENVVYCFVDRVFGRYRMEIRRRYYCTAFCIRSRRLFGL